MSILGRRCVLGYCNSVGSLVLEMGKLASFSTMYKPVEVDPSLQNPKIRVVDYRSDTVSKPSDAMRRAMFEAEVGDDVMGEDPTIIALEEKAAKMFGKEAALFVVSGTMGNLIATMVHCDRRGCEVIVGDKSHMLLWEQSGVAQVGGMQMTTVANLPDGMFSLEEVMSKLRDLSDGTFRLEEVGGVQMTTVANLPDGTFSLEEVISKLRDDSNIHTTQTALICVENTHNWCGGRSLPLPWLNQLAHISQEYEIPLHMDGARVFNAALCSGVTVAELVKDFASISVCLSKGLGAPIGSLLIGEKHFIKKARRIRKVLGGGWRQAGIVAAAGIYALDHNVDRLAVDHARTKQIAQAIIATNSKLVSLDLNSVTSNMLFLGLNSPQLSAQQFCDRLYTVTPAEAQALGDSELCALKIFTVSPTTVRFVLYCNLTEEDIAATIKKLQYVIREFDTKA